MIRSVILAWNLKNVPLKECLSVPCIPDIVNHQAVSLCHLMIERDHHLHLRHHQDSLDRSWFVWLLSVVIKNQVKAQIDDCEANWCIKFSEAIRHLNTNKALSWRQRLQRCRHNTEQLRTDWGDHADKWWLPQRWYYLKLHIVYCSKRHQDIVTSVYSSHLFYIRH